MKENHSKDNVSSRLRSCAEVLSMLHSKVFEARQPADRALSVFLRENRRFGSRDRRLVSEAAFAMFRWWGWVKLLAFGDFPPPAAGRIDGPAWAKIMLAALALDGYPDQEVMGALGRLCGLAPVVGPGQGETLADKARRVFGFFRSPLPEGALWSGLFPEWASREASGANLESLSVWMQRRPPLWLRAQGVAAGELAKELATSGLAAMPHPRVAAALKLEDARVNLYELPAFRAGRFEVQDLASQSIGLACAPKPGERWWDPCAGAGGKSLQLASLMGGKGSVLATDVRERKLEELRRRTRRSGLQNVRADVWDGKKLRGKSFDGVLVDAPCSCSGTWRRNPDARWRTSPEDVAELRVTQLDILRAASASVKSGGVLVYATCSFFERENGDVVRGFLEESPDFALEGFAHPLTGAPCGGMLQVSPADGDCDATFVARLKRQ